MKKAMLIVTLGVFTAWGNGVQADIGAAGKRDGVIVGSILAGTALAGPIGFIAGTVGGAWLGERVYEAEEVPSLKAELAQSQLQLAESDTQIAVLGKALNSARSQNLHYAQIVMDQLELAMLFKTGASGLTPGGQHRLQMLSGFLKDNPDVGIRLDGYADPRGDDNFNQQLSEARVAFVRKQLIDEGIPASRIAAFAHGKSQSQSTQGDLDGYALERVVTIQLSQDDEKSGLAATH